MKTVKRQVLLYKLLEFVLLMTEHEEYAVFATIEFKEKFAKTHWSIADVSFEMNLWLYRQNGTFAV